MNLIKYDFVFLENVPGVLTNTESTICPYDLVERNIKEVLDDIPIRNGYTLIIRKKKRKTCTDITTRYRYTTITQTNIYGIRKK